MSSSNLQQFAALPWVGIAVACGAGLLIGAERERRKRDASHTAVAGVRSFALVAVAGALAQALQMPWLVAAGAMLLVVLTGLAYFRTSTADVGITSELALFVTYLIGVTAVAQPVLAAGAAVVVTALLAARQGLHRFTKEVITPSEMHDGLILAAAVMVVLPLVPDSPVAWLAGVNPRKAWLVVVLLLAIQAAGHVALRALGAHQGLALSGLLSGFVTSTGTIAALGLRAKDHPQSLRSCVAGALMSCAATFVQFTLLCAALHPLALASTIWMSAAAIAAVLLTAAPWLQRGMPALDLAPTAGAQAVQERRMFGLRKTLGFAALLVAVTVLTAWVNRSAGSGAATLTAALAGLADAHAAAASAYSLGASGELSVAQVQWLVLIAMTTNSVSKIIASFAGGRAYALRVIPSLIAIAAAAWLPVWLLGP